MTRPLFNFTELRAGIAGNDWAVDPYVVVTGPPLSGKSALLLDAFRERVRLNHGYSLFFSAERFVNEDQIARTVVQAGSSDGAFPQTRTLLLSTSSQVVISASNFVNADTSISLSGQRGAHLDRSYRTLLPVLLSELLTSRKPIFVVVDSEDEATTSIEALLDGLCQAIGQGASINLLTSRTSPVGGPLTQTSLRRGTCEPKLMSMHPLDDTQVRAWSRSLGMSLKERDAVLIEAVTDGWSGTVFQYLTKLIVDERWQAQLGATK